MYLLKGILLYYINYYSLMQTCFLYLFSLIFTPLTFINKDILLEIKSKYILHIIFPLAKLFIYDNVSILMDNIKRLRNSDPIRMNKLQKSVINSYCKLQLACMHKTIIASKSLVSHT